MISTLSHLNFRDLGGLPLADGRRVKQHVLFRGPGPARLDDTHRDTLRALGIRLVCDLRSEPERVDGLHDCVDAEMLRLDLANDFADEASRGFRLLKERPDAEGAKAAMRAIYAAMPAALRTHWPPLLDAISAGHVPVLVHCTAGKDRTGVLLAMLLLFLGAPEDAVRDDYLLSAYEGAAPHGYRRESSSPIAQLLASAPDPGIIAALKGVDASYLATALDVVQREWRSIDGYFASIDVGPSRRKRLLEVLAEPAAGR
ncbi:tyrosine-protein phosphatase [Candidatus Binatia bacterium]|nr:tyrosine-protein phosphatase [Candidatus Binatia bacterium]